MAVQKRKRAKKEATDMVAAGAVEEIGGRRGREERVDSRGCENEIREERGRGRGSQRAAKEEERERVTE